MLRRAVPRAAPCCAGRPAVRACAAARLPCAFLPVERLHLPFLAMGRTKVEEGVTGYSWRRLADGPPGGRALSLSPLDGHRGHTMDAGCLRGIVPSMLDAGDARFVQPKYNMRIVTRGSKHEVGHGCCFTAPPPRCRCRRRRCRWRRRAHSAATWRCPPPVALEKPLSQPSNTYSVGAMWRIAASRSWRAKATGAASTAAPSTRPTSHTTTLWRRCAALQWA